MTDLACYEPSLHQRTGVDDEVVAKVQEVGHGITSLVDRLGTAAGSGPGRAGRMEFRP